MNNLIVKENNENVMDSILLCDFIGCHYSSACDMAYKLNRLYRNGILNGRVFFGLQSGLLAANT